jgi:hypothetical protein
MVIRTTQISVADGSVKVPHNREFGGKTFRLFSFETSMRNVHQEMDDRKEHFFMRFIRLPNNKGYVVYVRDKKIRRK